MIKRTDDSEVSPWEDKGYAKDGSFPTYSLSGLYLGTLDPVLANDATTRGAKGRWNCM